MTPEPLEHGGAVDETGLVLAFDTADPEFARGFEAGIQWGTMRLAEWVTRQTEAAGVPVVVDEFSELVHPSNIEMCMRMGEALGWQAFADDVTDDLLRVTFRRPTPQNAS